MALFCPIPLGKLTKTDTKDCSICLNAFSKAEPPVQLAECKHIFGKTCLVKWLSHTNTCPMCRKQIPLPTADTSRPFAPHDTPTPARPSRFARTWRRTVELLGCGWYFHEESGREYRPLPEFDIGGWSERIDGRLQAALDARNEEIRAMWTAATGVVERGDEQDGMILRT